jgi:putative transcriptional regulator
MDMFDFKKLNKIKPAKGRLLISEPLSTDLFFKRTVVLLCEHNEEGSFGFVINRYIDVEVNDVVDDFPTFDGRVSVGGPVQRDNLFYIHTLGDALDNSIEISDGLFMGGDFDTIKALVLSGKLKTSEIRFFVGYSGWEAGQLLNEMKENAWIVGRVNVEMVMDPEGTEAVWSETLKKMGKHYEMLSNFPEDPSLN